jgi:hypothetical protein
LRASKHDRLSILKSEPGHRWRAILKACISQRPGGSHLFHPRAFHRARKDINIVLQGNTAEIRLYHL